MSRRFPVKAHLTAEELVEFEHIREWHGRKQAEQVREYVLAGMAADSKAVPAGVLRNGPKWTANVSPVRWRPN